MVKHSKIVQSPCAKAVIPQCMLVYCNAPLEERFSLGIFTLFHVKHTQTGQGHCHDGIPGTQSSLPNCQALFEEWLGLGILTLGPVHFSQIVKRGCHVGMVGPEGFPGYLQSLLGDPGPSSYLPS